MINLGDHSEMNEPPVGIAITWVKAKLIEYYGSMEKFRRYLSRTFAKENMTWYQTMRNKPKHDLLYVYIIIDGVVEYRVTYVGYENGEIQMTGPLLKAPFVLNKKGFQGFRYTSFLF